MEEQGAPRIGRKGKRKLLEPGTRFPSDSRVGGSGEGEGGGGVESGGTRARHAQTSRQHRLAARVPRCLRFTWGCLPYWK